MSESFFKQNCWPEACNLSEFCEIFKNTFFAKHFWMFASVFVRSSHTTEMCGIWQCSEAVDHPVDFMELFGTADLKYT